MEMKSTAPSPPPPPYSSTMSYPGPQLSSYGYPHPATSKTPNHPVAPPTKEIGFHEVYILPPNHEPSLMVVVRKRNQRCSKTVCCFASVFLLIWIIAAAFIVRKILQSEGVSK